MVKTTALCLLAFSTLLAVHQAGVVEAADGTCIDGTCKDRLDDNGGWNPTFSSWLNSSRCNIQKIPAFPAMDAETFRRHFEDRPVIITGVDNSRARELTRKSVLLKTYGRSIVTLSSANTFSHAKKKVTLEKYLENYFDAQDVTSVANETWYMFGDNDYEGWADTFKAYREPTWFLPHEILQGLTSTYSFGIGSSGSGVPFHIHGPGFSEVLWGQKRWFLTPPDKIPDFSPDETSLVWLFTRYYEMLKSPDTSPFLYECIIQPGDLLFFPDQWSPPALRVPLSPSFRF